METSKLYDIFKSCGSVATDSRSIRGGELFFALKGENFDGNDFALKALDAGASWAVVTEGSAPACITDDRYASRIIPVRDTLKALQDLARYHRSMTFVDGKPLTVIGLTGTNGKTTTKELIKAVLSVHYNVTATEGNLNNNIGVPLTLLKINSSTQIAVVEMGASHPGDIKELVSVALPNYGLITNVGKAHLQGFGSFEGVMQTKGELYDYIQRTADRVFLNVDNPYLCRMASQRPDLMTIPYGVEYEGVSVLPVDAAHPYLRMLFPSSSLELNTRLVGAYNADNVMAAVAVGRQFGVSLDEAAAAIAAYEPSNSRSQMVRTGSNVVIVDAYNANPTSMNAALDNMHALSSGHKVAMLGDMLELGEDSVKEHLSIVKKASGIFSEVYLVGPEFRKALEECEKGTCVFRQFDTSEELLQWLEGYPVKDAAILVKGSRGMRMEKVLPAL